MDTAYWSWFPRPLPPTANSCAGRSGIAPMSGISYDAWQDPVPSPVRGRGLGRGQTLRDATLDGEAGRGQTLREATLDGKGRERADLARRDPASAPRLA